MTIAYREYEGIGARVFTPQGPFTSLTTNQGVDPSPQFNPGTIVAGDAESEYVSLIFAPTSSVTLNQGDFLWWDQSYTAVQTTTGSGSAPFGASVGVFFMGGRVGDPAAAPFGGNQWTYTFAAGIYLIWAQRAGTQVLNIATGGTQTKPANSTATLGQLSQPSSPLSGSMGIQNVYSAPGSWTFTATTVSGSNILTVPSTMKGVVRGQMISGTGIPSNTYVSDFSGSTVTISNAATASGSAVTMTVSNASSYGNVTSGSNQITNVPVIPGIYPNQTISGTGIPGSTTITSIQGNPGNYTINISANATATNTGVALTTAGYQEGFLRWPQVASQN